MVSYVEIYLVSVFVAFIFNPKLRLEDKETLRCYHTCFMNDIPGGLSHTQGSLLFCRVWSILQVLFVERGTHLAWFSCESNLCASFYNECTPDSSEKQAGAEVNDLFFIL